MVRTLRVRMTGGAVKIAPPVEPGPGRDGRKRGMDLTIAATPCRVAEKRTLARGIYDMWVCCPAAAEAKPGQFVGVLCGGFELRRPISICEIDAARGMLRLVFQVRGQGTRWLSAVREGECVDILAPLGNGFIPAKPGQRAVFVGGGIGVPPLLEAAKPYGANADAILGFRTASLAILGDDFSKVCRTVTLVTEDGTGGERGLVTAPLSRRLDEAPCDAVYACGPRPMLAAVAAEAAQRRIACFVSMEARMACGMGACLSCAVPAKAPGGGQQMLQVCKHGPVFDAATLVW